MQTALMYHDVVPTGFEDTSGFPGRDAALYKVTPGQFDAHLRAIQESLTAHHPPDSPDLPDPPSLGPTATSFGAAGPPDPTITFDDGGVSALRAAEILERWGFKGHFFVTTNYIGTRGFATELDLRELARRGHTVGSHSCSHPLRMGHSSWPQLLDEWQRSRSVLGDILGVAVDSASVPGGDFAPAVAEAAADAGFTQLFTSEPTSEHRRVFGLTLIGRFTISRRTSAANAAALAAGEWLPCARQAVLWSAKKMTKRVGGAHYLHLRRALLGGGDVRWGDRS